MYLWTECRILTVVEIIYKNYWQSASKKSLFKDKPSPVCKANSRTKCPKGKTTFSLYLDSYTTPSLPPKLLLSSLWHFSKKGGGEVFFFFPAATLLPPSLPPPPLPPHCSLSERMRQRNFIEKMEGTGKTRVPGGVLQGLRLHQRLPFSAGRWTHNGKMSVAAVTRTSHWLGFGRGWGEGVIGVMVGTGWGSQHRRFNTHISLIIHDVLIHLYLNCYRLREEKLLLKFPIVPHAWMATKHAFQHWNQHT